MTSPLAAEGHSPGIALPLSISLCALSSEVTRVRWAPPGPLRCLHTATVPVGLGGNVVVAIAVVVGAAVVVVGAPVVVVPAAVVVVPAAVVVVPAAVVVVPAAVVVVPAAVVVVPAAVVVVPAAVVVVPAAVVVVVVVVVGPAKTPAAHRATIHATPIPSRLRTTRVRERENLCIDIYLPLQESRDPLPTAR